MSQPYATRPEPRLSLPIRMDRKRRQTRVGIAGLVAGIPLLGGAAYNFTISGSEAIAGYLAIMGAGALGVGITMLVRAARNG